MKTQFFPRQAIPKSSFCFTFSLHWWYSIPSMVWFWQLPDPMKRKLFLKLAKIRNSRNSQNSVWKPNFFLGKLYQKLFLLYTLITLVILQTEFGLIWTTPWPDENELLLKLAKIRISRNSQNSLWKPNFFLGQQYKKYFLLNNVITLLILHTEYGLICTTPWPDEKDLFLKFLFREIQNFRVKTNFFPRQVIPKFFFVLRSPYTGGTPHRVWFYLDNSLTRWKWIISKILFSRKPKVPDEIPTFFLGNSYQKFFLLYTFITLVIVHT